MTSHRNELTSWGVLLAGLLIAPGLVMWSQSLPPAVPADAGPEHFSAERAMRVVRHLTDDIGMRLNGTPAQEQAAQYLADELRSIPGVDVEIQRVSGVHQYSQEQIPFPPFVYHTVNVVARIEGREPDAVLLNAHYDTLTEGVGAGDDAIGVAAIVEAARILATGPQLDHSIVINLNGAEEVGMLGAAGFLEHRWARDVRAYLYIDGGPRGKPIIIGAGPGNAWLLRTYAGAAQTAACTAISQDVIDSGMLPHNGDFTPFHDAGIAGIDIAALADFWAIHTPLDTPERVDLSTVQLMGDELLAGARALAQSELPGNVDQRRFVYYDLLSLYTLVYSTDVARLLAGIALALVVVALLLAIRRKELAIGHMGIALGRLLLIVFAMPVASIVAAVFLGFVVGRPHGWFSAPWVAILAFGAPAIAAALGIQSLRLRCPREKVTLATWAAALIFWSLWSLLAAATGAGSGYVPLWWSGLGAIGFLGALFKPTWRPWLWLVSFVPCAILPLEFLVQMIPFIIADVGLVPSPAPLDGLIAMVIALTAIIVVPVALVPIAGARLMKRVALGCALLAVVGIVVAALHEPYTAERPKRVRASIVVRDGENSLLIASRDALPLDAALADVQEAVPYDRPWAVLPLFEPVYTYQLPADPPSFYEPRIEVLSSSYDERRDVRELRIRLVSNGPQLRLFIPQSSLVAWSLGVVPEQSLDENRMLVMFEGAEPEARELTLELHGQEPVEVELIDVRGPSEAPEIRALRERLPDWVALETNEIWAVRELI